MKSKQQQLEALIDNAFHGVRLGSGVSLHETIVIDNYGTDAERAQARAGDEHEDWRKLLELPYFTRIRWIGGLSFYDAEGFRFHLPAYLTLAVRDFDSEVAGEVIESLMFHLTNLSDYNRERLALLTQSQRSCVHDVLVFLRDTYELESEELDDAILNYWAVEIPDEEAR